jgi:hypothetical protein
MKNLKEYIEECEGVALATPANTMGMGNPGMTDTNTMTEPIKSVTAKAKKEKLKKKIKESLLDDEEDLIKDIKEFSNNPFQFIATLMSDKVHLMDYKQEIDKVFKKFIKELKPSYPVKIVLDANGVKFTLNENIEGYDPLIILRPGRLWSKNDDAYGIPDDKQLVIFFTEPFMEDYFYYGFKDERYYRDWIHTIAKKYNLKKSKKDEFVYYI